ncbi:MULTISPECIES: hypothetical protein [unclassified Granulicatella]|uniref:hypothetical protein n=1 Tax=unclassified Granulicatella TaxID=2630493 RepID=UPI0010741CD9|nr:MULTISPECIES: hypothetical protein [unclassified Granulicatella]MBF0780667.1 hypothetical protein [Granulicatella sp. 19428wC4_WM01]TFU94244.1 hypothetical protein E4T68_06115 [Granulicatella sp. WM01]
MRATYMLESFVVHMNRDSMWGRADKIIENMTLWVCNLFFGLTKLLYQAMDFLLSLIRQIDIVSIGSPIAFSVATGLYHRLFETFVIPIVFIGGMYYFFQYLVVSVKSANRFALVFLSVLALNIGFYHKGAELLTNVQTVVHAIETEIVKGVVSPLHAQREDNQDKDSIEILRDFMFEHLIMDSFMTVNFGLPTYDEKAEKYLIPVGTENVKKAIEEKELLADKEKEVFFQSYKGIDKVFISLISVFKAIIVGGIIVLILMMRVIVQLILVLMIFCLPVLSIVSFIPRFNAVLFKYISQMLMVCSVSPLATLLALIIFYVFNVLDQAVLAFGSGRTFDASVLFVATFVKYVFVVLCWKNKTKLFSLLTTGNFSASVAPRTHANIHRYSDNNPYNDEFLNHIVREMKGNNRDKATTTREESGENKMFDGMHRDRYSVTVYRDERQENKHVYHTNKETYHEDKRVYQDNSVQAKNNSLRQRFMRQKNYRQYINKVGHTDFEEELRKLRESKR